jgi:hypothetical protein
LLDVTATTNPGRYGSGTRAPLHGQRIQATPQNIDLPRLIGVAKGGENDAMSLRGDVWEDSGQNPVNPAHAKLGEVFEMGRSGALAAIGNTPVVKLDRLVEPEMAEIWVKLESDNPTGSYKDRMALAMIEGAERSGRLRPGQVVVEYTGGSTGSSLAFVCSIKGYPLRIVSSDAFAIEKIKTMQALVLRGR